MQVQLSYSECAEAPVEMSDGVAIAISGKVYYGGGGCDNNDDKYYIHCLNPSQDEWSTLPKLPVSYFGLGEVKGKLVTVGGYVAAYTPTSNIHTYHETSKTWKQTIPPMPTARSSPAVASLPTHFVAAGGWISQDGVIDIVEIYSSNINQWNKTDSLLHPRCNSRIAICNNTVYLTGGWDYGGSDCNEAFIAPIDKLISNSIQTNQNDAGATANEDSVWEEIVNTPSYRPVVVTMYDIIIVVGGVNNTDFYTPTQEIHAYSSSMSSWVYIGDLPSPIAYSAIVTLSPTEFLVIGGQEKDGERLPTVYKATLKPKV